MTLRIREALQVQGGSCDQHYFALRTWRVSRAGVLLDSRLTLDAALDTAAVLARPGEPCLVQHSGRTVRPVDLEAELQPECEDWDDEDDCSEYWD